MAETTMEKKPLGFLTFCRTALSWMSLLLLCGLALLNVLRTGWVGMDEAYFWQEAMYWQWDSLLAFAVAGSCMALLFGGLYRLTRRIPVQGLCWMVTAAIFMVGVCWVLVVDFAPRADAQIMAEIAQDWLQQGYSAFAPDEYLFFYPYQMGYGLLLMQMLKLFGPENIRAVQMVHALAAAMCYFFTAQIGLVLFGEKRGRMTLLLGMGFWCAWMFSPFVYGNIPSLMLGLAAIWMQLVWQLRGGSWVWIAGSGAALGASILLKSFSLIFLVGQAILLFLHTLRTHRKAALAWVLALLLCWQGGFGAMRSWAEQKTGQPLNEGVPKIGWIVMGLQGEVDQPVPPGWYNGYQHHLYEDVGYDADRMQQVAQQDLKARLEEFARDPVLAVKFFGQKIQSQWADPTAESLWLCYSGPEPEEPYPPLQEAIFSGGIFWLILHWMNWFQSLVWVCGAGYLLAHRKQVTLEQLLPGLLILGGFLFQLFWEGKSQYLVPYYMLALPYAAAGVYEALCWLRRHLRHRADFA